MFFGLQLSQKFLEELLRQYMSTFQQHIQNQRLCHPTGKTMKHFPTCIATLLLFFSHGASAFAAQLAFSDPVTPMEIRKAFYEYSPIAIVRALKAGDEKNWDYILSRIEQGDPDWIATAMEYIASGADAGSAIDLKIALALALKSNPLMVLSHAASGISLKDVCSAPFIEAEKQMLLEYGRQALAALEDVTEDYVRMEKKICVMVLKDMLDKVKRPASAQ